MLDFVPLVALLGLVYAGINFLKYLTNKQWNAVITQLIVWVVGVLFAWLFGESDFGGAITVGDTGQTLATLNFASLVLVGMVVGSAATVAYDVKSAIDRNDSAVTPKLIPGE